MNHSRLINQKIDTSETLRKFNVVTDMKIKLKVNESEGLEKNNKHDDTSELSKNPETLDFYTKIPKKKNLWYIHSRKKRTSLPACNSSENLIKSEKYLLVHSKKEKFLRNNMHATLIVTNEVLSERNSPKINKKMKIQNTQSFDNVSPSISIFFHVL